MTRMIRTVTMIGSDLRWLAAQDVAIRDLPLPLALLIALPPSVMSCAYPSNAKMPPPPPYPPHTPPLLSATLTKMQLALAAAAAEIKISRDVARHIAPAVCCPSP